MTEADFSLEVSVARPSDHKSIERLCTRAVGPDDYLLAVASKIGFNVDSWGEHCLVFEKSI